MLKLVPPRPGRSPYWYVRGSHRGVTLDRSTKETERAKAGRWLRQWRDDIDRGQLSRRGEPTFLDAAVNYMAATGVEKHVRPVLDHFGHTPLRTIDQAAIDHAALALYPGTSPATRNRQVHTVVSAILKHAGISRAIRRPKGAHVLPPVRWLWPEQAWRFIAAAKSVDVEFGILVAVLCYTGQRLSEALALEIDNLRLAENFVFVPTSKSGEPRAVFLPPYAVAALASHPCGLDRPGETIFRFRKNGRLYDLLRTARNGAGEDLAWVGFHTLCHTWATWMRRYGGLDTRGLVGTGRWKSEKSAARYAHVVASEESARAVMLPTPPAVQNPWKALNSGAKRRKSGAS